MTLRSKTTSRHFFREIASCLTNEDVLCGELRLYLESQGLMSRWFAVELATRECLNNAIIHGSRGNPDMKVRVDVHVGTKWIIVRIANEGLGFDWKKAQDLPLPDETAESGRGMSISARYADRTVYNRQGNRVALWFSKKALDGGTAHHVWLQD